MCLAAFSHSERTFSLPAAAPAGKLTRCLTPPPALATVRLVVTLAAGSPAGSGWLGACVSASFRAGRVSQPWTCAIAARFPTTLSQPRGEGGRKTLHALVQEGFEPGPENGMESGRWGKTAQMNRRLGTKAEAMGLLPRSHVGAGSIVVGR